ncbi:LITAF-like zinc finger domain-containing protein, partial [Penicillium lividum]
MHLTNLMIKPPTDRVFTEPPPAYTLDPPMYNSAPVEQRVPHASMVVPLHLLDKQPAYIDCPFCENLAETSLMEINSGSTRVTSVLCCLICPFLICLPSEAGMFIDYDHYCTKCGKRVAHKSHDIYRPVMVFGPN